MRVLAFEPFDAGSHRAVRESISRHSAHSWIWLTRPGRAWKWRMRTAAVEFAEMVRERMVISSAPDLEADENAANGDVSNARDASVTSTVPNSGAGRTAKTVGVSTASQKGVTSSAPNLEAGAETAIVAEEVDVLFVTSLMSASDLVALLPGEFRGKPLVLYMHENQAVYPFGETMGAAERDRDAHFLLTNITSALAADRVIFNSQWNRRSFLDGIKQLFEHSRDGKLSHVADAIEKKSCVIWPPVETPVLNGNLPVPLSLGRAPGVGGEGAFDQSRGAEQNTVSNPHPSPLPRGEGTGATRANDTRILHNPEVEGTTRVVWPNRWEHDKGPDELLRIARQYCEPYNIRWIILGERYDKVPAELKQFEREFGRDGLDRIEHCGFVEDRESYWQWLSKADWVLSTARHEFFGIAVVEALLFGCGGKGALPWLPPELSYPELLPEEARGLSPMNPPGDPGESGGADGVRAAIRKHLEPAIAQNAVRRIDGVLNEVCVSI